MTGNIFREAITELGRDLLQMVLATSPMWLGLVAWATFDALPLW
jgi:hypothetical protein